MYNDVVGAFLVPYLICVVIGGIPLFYLEVALGQFMAQGGPKAWRICPILQGLQCYMHLIRDIILYTVVSVVVQALCNSACCLGIGLATTVIVFFLNCYYNVILAWAFYYMFASFTTELPWESCDNYWNTDSCTTFDELKVSSCTTFDELKVSF